MSACSARCRIQQQNAFNAAVWAERVDRSLYPLHHEDREEERTNTKQF